MKMLRSDLLKKNDRLQIELEVLLDECKNNIQRNEKFPDSDYARGQIQSDKFVVKQLTQILDKYFKV